MNIPIYKIVVLGEGTEIIIAGRVGKTSMSLKYVKGEFSNDQYSTTNASYLEKKEKVEDDHLVKMAIWVYFSIIKDTAGQ
jgi:GTPase SAR1 family protein